jgi:hypothetical protein
MKKLITIAIALAMLATMILPVAAFAANNDSNQSATSTQATTISIVGKLGDTEVNTITFPSGVSGDSVEAPYNDVENSGDPQVVAESNSEPVVRLLNTSSVTLTPTLQITDWTGTTKVVASEYYELVIPTNTGVSSVPNVLSANGLAATANTDYAIAASAYGALYLKIVLTSSGTSTSTITILGQN